VRVASTSQSLCNCGSDSWYTFSNLLDPVRDGIDVCEIGAGDFDTDRTFDAGGQHIDPVPDGWYPDVGESRHANRSIQLVEQFIGRHTGAPLASGFDLTGRFEHLKGCGVGGGVGAPRLTEDSRYFRYSLDHTIRDLQKFRSGRGRQSGQRRGHVQNVALIQWGHEFAAQPVQGPYD